MMYDKEYALIGGGNHAREVMSHMGHVSMKTFVDDEYYDPEKCEKYVSPLSEFNPDKWVVMVAIADPKIKKEIISRLPEDTVFFSFIHDSAIILEDVHSDSWFHRTDRKFFSIFETPLDSDVILGSGVFIGAGCVLTREIKIDDHVILNRGVHVGHNCKIGSYSSLMPNVTLSGNVTLGESVYMGTHSVVREETIINHNITVGLNSGVINHLLDSGTYIGTPAKLLKK